ncbi:hypothetical protein K9M79_03800 [Candidatus Woesearchaeota archaeon]|nr:hypothetical protein [Candidatus Woesearchaeota archaeon]
MKYKDKNLDIKSYINDIKYYALASLVVSIIMQIVFYEGSILSSVIFVLSYFYMGLPGVIFLSTLSKFDRMTKLIVGPMLSIGAVLIISYFLGYFLGFHIMYHWMIPVIIIAILIGYNFKKQNPKRPS